MIQAAYVNQSGGISIGTTTDPGLGGLEVNGQMFAPNMTPSTGSTSGAVCWNASTGKFTVDTTRACR